MIEEKITVGEGTEFPLKGILTLPENLEKPLPAVVFVHGSGSSNMDEKVMKLTPFKDLAEGLAKHGIASVRYDKRSFAHGFKLIKEKDVTVTMETIEDAILGSTEHPCYMAFIDANPSTAKTSSDMEAEIARLHRDIELLHQSYKEELAVVRADDQKKIDYLRAENDKKDRIIERLLEK